MVKQFLDYSKMSEPREQNKRTMTTAAEKTIVLTDPAEIINNVVNHFSHIKHIADICADSNAPYSHFMLKPVREAFIQLKNRGVRIRFITEITKENLHYSKELMKIVELRHLDGIKGNFGISDGINGMEYRASPTSKKEDTPSEYIISNVRSLVEQQQYFFDMLWSRAIPAKQRIKEIEQGAKREFLETIRDLGEIQKIALDLIKKAEEEILILFSTANAFRRQEKAGVLELLKEAAKLNDVRVRILVPIDTSNNDNTLSERVQQLKNAGIDIRAIKQTFQNKLTMLIVDQDLCLTVELNDDATREEETYDEAIVLATYSNSEATVFSYVSIFENLWIQTQMHNRQEQETSVS